MTKVFSSRRGQGVDKVKKDANVVIVRSKRRLWTVDSDHIRYHLRTPFMRLD